MCNQVCIFVFQPFHALPDLDDMAFDMLPIHCPFALVRVPVFAHASFFDLIDHHTCSETTEGDFGFHPLGM